MLMFVDKTKKVSNCFEHFYMQNWFTTSVRKTSLVSFLGDFYRLIETHLFCISYSSNTPFSDVSNVLKQ